MKRLDQHTFLERLYVMKKHWATRLHDDLRLEWNRVLLSWALPAGPSWHVGEARTAIEMEDHKKANLLFEGVHETGLIMVWDRGTWEPHTDPGDVLPGLERGCLRFTLRGERLQGIFTLTRTGSGGRTRRAVWMLRKEADLFNHLPEHKGVLQERPRSICTGRTREEIIRDWNKGKEGPPSLFG